MKIGDRLEVEGWPTKIYLEEKKIWKGEVKKAWKKNEHQFFVLEHCDLGFTFMGVVCEGKYKLFSLIANAVKREINCSFITVFPCKKLNSVTVIIRKKKYVAFLSDISDRENIISTVEGNKTIEEILEEAVRRFDEEKEEIMKEISLRFSEECFQIF